MSKKKVGTLEFIKFYKENGKAFKAYPLRDRARVQLTFANMKISKLDSKSKIYMQRVEEFNQGMVYLYTGKWLSTEAIRTKDKQTWKKAFESFNKAIDIADKLNDHLQTGNEERIEFERLKIIQSDSNVIFSGDVPMVPDITPIVLLEGSSYDMGFQYASQLKEIYGDWMLRRHATRVLSDEEIKIIKIWEQVHKENTPEVIDFVRGWVDYSNAEGISISYYQVLDLWVGHKEPAESYLNAESGMPELPPLACTAIAAWNTATEDGKLVVGATGDHDMSYQITIVMYPDDGIPLIFTPFEATGTLAVVGPNYFFGHPGMNLSGLAYVHHGGGPKLLEPIKDWGYGIRRGASVLHNLRYKNKAKDALAQEMAWPLGDIGYGDQATVGGFYADDEYGYVIESRKEPLCIREAGILGEQDYLFSNNSVMHPDAVNSEWMSKIRESWSWDEDGGWRPKNPQGMTKSISMIFKWFTGRLKLDELMSRGMMFAYWNSYNRNLFLNSMGKKFHGKLNTQNMMGIYRTTGTMPDGDFKKIKKEYIDRGKWGTISAAHSSNALVVVMKPSDGLYSLCTGPAIRGAAPISPDLAISIFNERNAFWDIKLREKPMDTVKESEILAKDLLKKAKVIYDNNQIDNRPKEIYNELMREYEKFTEISKENLMGLNKAIRIYSRVHVIARQFINHFEIPEKFYYK